MTLWRTIELSRQLTRAGWRRTRRKGGRFNRPQVRYTRFWTGHTAPSLELAGLVERRIQATAARDLYP